MKRLLLCCLLAAAPLAAQRDFLSTDEAAQIRENQGPNERLKLYAAFARARVDLARDMLARQRTGRTAMVHDALEDYVNILDAIDQVADDALARKADIKVGMSAVAAAEAEMLPRLKKIEDSAQPDAALYAFALRQSIEATQDSLDSAREDLTQRAGEVEAREERERQERSTMSAPAKTNKPAETAAPAGKPARKPPTLKRPGEN